MARPEPPDVAEEPVARSLRVMSAIRLAFAFLTILPLARKNGAVGEADIRASRFAYPLVGAVVGLVLAALSEGLMSLSLDPRLSAVLLLVTWQILAGGLHLDGLADTFDGLFLWGGPERRLAVMRDPHVGSFGVSVIVLVLIGKFAALDCLTGSNRALAVIAAAAVARTLILVAAGLSRYARPEGTGRVVVEAATRRDAWTAALLVVAFGWVLEQTTGLIASLIALVIAVLFARVTSRRLGGITGDILGALVELTELTVLFVLAIK